MDKWFWAPNQCQAFGRGQSCYIKAPSSDIAKSLHKRTGGAMERLS